MFCDKCGTPLQAGQQFCSSCGKELPGITVAGYPQRGRVAEHVRLVGILWLALSALHAVGGVILFIVANTIFLHLHEFGAPQNVPSGFLHSLLCFLAILLLVKSAVGFAAGWGLLQREPWARLLAVVLAFLALFNIPFGTALGVYTMWVLLPMQSEQEYEAQSREMSIA
jgi:zinc-ribbon domain